MCHRPGTWACSSNPDTVSAHLPPLGAAHVGSPLLSAEALAAPGLQRQRLAAATATCGVRGAGWQLWQQDLGVYQQHARGHQRLEAARLKQIRQLSGLAQSVALPILWRELSLCPFYHAWVIRAACFWNALASTQGFHKQIALDAVMLALHRHVRNWVHGLRHSLSVVGYNMHLDPAAMHNIDISELASVFRRTWRVFGTIWHPICVYAHQLVRGCALTSGVLLNRQTTRQIYCGCHCLVRLCELLRFRTGCHALPNVIGTRTSIGGPRPSGRKAWRPCHAPPTAGAVPSS